MQTGYSAPRATEFYDTFSSFPLIGKKNTLYTTRDSGLIYLYDTTLNSYFQTSDTSVVNPDAPEEGTTYYARLATGGKLNACTYNNGIAGVGATLTGDAFGIVSTIDQTGKIDTKVPVAGDIVLIKNELLDYSNGLYEITTLGGVSTNFVLTRVGDYNEASEIYPSTIFITDGSVYINRYFTQTTDSPLIGTDALIFNVSTLLGSVNPTQFVDTATSSALPTCTYADNLVYLTIPAYGATLTATANGALGAINGVTMSSGKSLLVRSQVDLAHNGDYKVVNAGSATQKWVLKRINSTDAGFRYNVKEWVVSNVGSTLFGNRYSLTSPLSLINLNIGTTNLTFTKSNSSDNIYTADGTLAGNRTVNGGGYTLSFNGAVKMISPSVFATDDALAVWDSSNTNYLFRIKGNGDAAFHGATVFLQSIQNLFFTSQSRIDLGNNNNYVARGEIGSPLTSHIFDTTSLLTTANTYIMKVLNGGGLKFSIDKDGVLNNAAGPVGNVGRVSGDIYYDTAANALANGDLIAIRKV